MRFGPCSTRGALPFKPPDLLDSIYGVSEPPGKQKKCRSLEKSDMKLQNALIERIKREMPPEFFLDPNIFPVGVDVLVVFSSMAAMGGIPLLSVGSNFVCVYESKLKLHKLIRSDSGRVVATGSLGELFSYAHSNAPRAMGSIVDAARLGTIPRPERDGDLADLLRYYRIQRKFSLGLDRISKTDELRRIDQESVVNKFLVRVGDIGSTVCFHIGSGNNISGSQYALHQFYDRVICVDPRLVDGPDSIGDCFDLDKIPDGHDIYSDVAYGDTYGMITDHDKNNMEQLYSYACRNPGNNVVVKYALQRGIKASGDVLRKPRPHNLEIIVRLTPDGDSFDDIHDEYFEAVCSANEGRNDRIFKQQFGNDVKPLFNTKGDIGKILRRSLRVAVPAIKPRFTRVNKNQIIYEQRGGKANDNRISAFKDAVRKEMNFDGSGTFAHLDIDLREGNVNDFDPGFPDVNFAARSLIATVRRDRGFKIINYMGFTMLRRLS